MSAPHPFLAVPIKAQISADGMLLSADPPVWRLHFVAGGDDDGAMAVPGLAALAALSLRTRMRLARPVRATDEESDVELWVEATPNDGIAEISITGWREIAEPIGGFVGQHEAVQSGNTSDDGIMIGPDLKIVQAPASLASEAIGQHLGAVFIVEGDANGGIPLVDALIERRSVHGALVGIVGSDMRYSLDLAPHYGPDRGYLGHIGALQPIVEAPVEQPAPVTADLPMGRQFASVLKQPLSRILANADTMGSRRLGPLRENYAEYAQDIANAARHLSELVNDMEDLEAIDRPDFSVARDRVELGDVARRVSGLLALKASDHGISVIVPAETETVDAVGEFRRILQILLNLVGNAIRYAPDGSTVTVTIEKQGDFASVGVADEGQGVPAEDRERVFEKFERLGRSGDGGSGLGLYISRRLARAMGGDLIVSDAPGGGALFRLTLPAR